MKYCPQCGSSMGEILVENQIRKGCPDRQCGYVFFNNPTPVVAMIVETDEGVVLAHNVAWPKQFYSIITGFLEEHEDPEQCAIRETYEELGLHCLASNFIGVYPFAQQNQVLMAYHIKATGKIKLNHELDDYKIVPKDELKGWGFGTGLAVNDWLERGCLTPELAPE